MGNRRVLQVCSLTNLPTEINLKILNFLSVEDLVKNVSLVSKQFHLLSKDSSLKNSFTVQIRQSGSLPNFNEDSSDKSSIEDQSMPSSISEDQLMPNSYEDLSVPNSLEDHNMPRSSGVPISDSDEDHSVPNSFEDLSIPNSFEDLSIPNSIEDHSLPNSYEDHTMPNSNELPINSNELPINSNEFPINSNELPINSNELPINSEDPPPMLRPVDYLFHHRSHQIRSLTIECELPTEDQEEDEDIFQIVNSKSDFIQNFALPKNYFCKLFQEQHRLKQLSIKVKDPSLNKLNNDDNNNNSNNNNYLSFYKINNFLNSSSNKVNSISKATGSLEGIGSNTYLDGIGRCTYLENLDIYLLPISVFELEEIMKLKNLKTLSIRLSPEVTAEKFVECLTRLDNLVQLSVSFTSAKVTDEVLQVVTQKCRNLKVLRIHCRRYNENDLTFPGIRGCLSGLSNLQIYSLKFNETWKQDDISKDFYIFNHFIDGYVGFYRK
jgi:hypothetical protein